MIEKGKRVSFPLAISGKLMGVTGTLTEKKRSYFGRKEIFVEDIKLPPQWVTVSKIKRFNKK